MAEAAKSSPSSHRSTLYFINSLIGVALVFGTGMLPPMAPLTPIGMKVGGIFLGMLWFWSTVGILWPSLLGLLALGISGIAPMREVMGMSFGHPNTVLILFSMVLFGAIQEAGVTRYVSRWFLTRKIINGKPTVFSFVFIYTTYVLASLLANILPALLFMWGILYDVLKESGYKRGDKYATLMVIGTLFGAVCGQGTKPFIGAALLMVGAFENASGLTMNYMSYIMCSIVLSTVSLLAYVLLMKYVFRPDTSKISNITIEQFTKHPLPAMEATQKLLFFSLFAFLVLAIAPSIAPKTFPGIVLINKLGPWGLGIAFVALLNMVTIAGKPLLNFKEVAAKYLIWDVYFLVCMAIAISEALTKPSTGISPFLTEIMHPFFGGHSAAMLTVVTLAFCIIATQVANNVVLIIIIMPALAAFFANSGGSFAGTATLIILGAHIAILTPAGSPYAAVLFANKEWLEPKDIYTYGSAIVVLTIAVYLLVGIPLSTILF